MKHLSQPAAPASHFPPSQDYSNYSVIDYNNLSDEDHNAGAYGDLYNDVMEEAGYDAWDIEYPEIDFEDEKYLEFYHFSEYFYLKDYS